MATTQAAIDQVNESPARPTVRPPEQPTTILVADDEHLVASGIASNLTDLGYHVIGPAADGEEALRLCQSVRPHLAMLDIRMPKQNGLATASTLFQRFGIPVVILSAYSDPEYVGDASRVGVFGYLLKPVTQDQLRVAVSVAWSRYLESVNQGEEIHVLRTRLENRKVIEQAKWILVKRRGLDEPEAMRMLQRHARNNRRTLVDVARSIIENVDLLDGGG